MTDLQTSLFVVGGAFLVGVIFYNKWQEYKDKKSLGQAFSESSDDVLTKFGSGLVRLEPTLDSVTQTPHANTLDQVAFAQNKDLSVDDLIDCVLPLILEAPVQADKILPIIQHGYVGNKSVRFIGEDTDGNWGPIARGHVYSSLLAGVQLANLANALNEIEYSELVTRLRQIADELGAELDLPEMAEVMEAARSLYQFVTKYDAQLGVNIQSNAKPWEIDSLLAALRRQGFETLPDGRMAMPDCDGGLLFSLSTNTNALAETTNRLTLLLDVPRVAPERDGYGAMVACANSLATRLGGVLVDDSNVPLAQAQLIEVAAQVNAFYREMESVKIPAGSTRALRLFS